MPYRLFIALEAVMKSARNPTLSDRNGPNSVANPPETIFSAVRAGKGFRFLFSISIVRASGGNKAIIPKKEASAKTKIAIFNLFTQSAS
jgi:hypothetical protein